MRTRSHGWTVTGIIGVAVMVCVFAGCHADGGLAAPEAIDVAELPQVAPIPAADDPAPTVDEPTSVADDGDAIALKIEELFTRLAAEAEENAGLQATIVELQRQVEMLQRRLLLAESVSGARPPRPPRPPDASLPVRPEGAPETPDMRPLIGDAAAYEAVEYHAIDVPEYVAAEYTAADVPVLDPDDE